MTTLCSYVLTKDTGLAPNPFWGTCTLAVCTPNRQGAIVDFGDWIAGFSPACDGSKLIYAMQLSGRVHLNDYFNDPRFALKKPNLRGTWEQRCGDNFYSRAHDGTWTQHRNRFHIGAEYRAKDTRNPLVFVSQSFWYFGAAAAPVPPIFRRLVGTRGIRVNHPPDLVLAFLDWLRSSHTAGSHGTPRHNPDRPS